MRLRSGLAGLFVLLLAARADAQSGRISGVVTDANGGIPLSGVTITVAGVRGSTVTRADGRYVFVGAPTGTQRVRATRIGYAPGEDTVSVSSGGSATADFSLHVTAVVLDAEVVVGYGSVRRGDITGAVSSVTPDVAQVPAQSMETLLQGKVAGGAPEASDEGLQRFLSHRIGLGQGRSGDLGRRGEGRRLAVGLSHRAVDVDEAASAQDLLAGNAAL